MVSRTNLAGFTIVPEYVTFSTRNETKEDAFDNVVLKFSRTFARGTDPGSTTKSTKASKVLFLSSCLEDSRRILTVHCHGIVDTQVMEEGVGPKLNIEVGTNKKGTNMVTDNTMSTLDWTILMERIRSSKMDFMVMAAKTLRISGLPYRSPP